MKKERKNRRGKKEKKRETSHVNPRTSTNSLMSISATCSNFCSHSTARSRQTETSMCWYKFSRTSMRRSLLVTAVTADFVNLSSSSTSFAFSTSAGEAPRLLILLTEPRRYALRPGAGGKSHSPRLVVTERELLCCLAHWPRDLETFLSHHTVFGQPLLQLTTCGAL